MTNQHDEILNIWVKAQTKLVENFTEASNGMQNAVGKDNMVELLIETYNKWYGTQVQIMEDFVNELKKHANIDLGFLNGHFENFKKVQDEFGKKWMEGLKETSQKYFGSDFLGGHNGTIDAVNQNWNKFYSSLFAPYNQPFKEFSSAGFGAYNVMLETVKDYMKAFYPSVLSKK